MNVMCSVMNEHRKNSSQRNYLSKNFIRKPIILSLKAIRVILTGSPDHFTQVIAAEDIKCQRQNPSQVV